MRWLISALLLITSLLCFGENGWRLTSRYYHILESPENARLETVFLYNGYMKTETGDLYTTFDIERGIIIYINHSSLNYWKGNAARFNKEVRAEMNVMIERQLLDIPEEEREAMRFMYNEILNATLSSNLEAASNFRSFKVRNEGRGEVIAGYSTDIYTVLEVGQIVETIWIAPALPIGREFDFVNLSNFLNHIASGSFAGSFESSNEYFDLLQKGYPMKVVIDKPDGHTYVSEVVEAIRVELSEADFSIPNGYSEGSLTEVGVWEAFK